MTASLGTLSVKLQAVTKGFHSSLDLADRSVKKTAKGMSVMGATAKSAGKNIQGLQANVLSLNHVIAGLTGYALTKAIAKTVEAGTVMQSFERRISVLANSMRLAGEEQITAAGEMQWLTKTALKTGSAFDELSKAYTRLVPMAVANSISITKIKDSLEGTIGAGVVMGATTQEMARGFVAIGQIVGKNALQMEELRQQLGEALPNAMLIAADGLTKLRREANENAKQVSISELVKMINNSSIDGAKFIEIWTRGTAQYKKFAAAAADTVAGQVQNLKTNLTVGLGTFMLRSGIQNNITAMMKSLNSAIGNFFDMSASDAKDFGSKFIDTIADISSETFDFFNNLKSDVSGLYDGLKTVGGIVGGVVTDAIQTIRSLPFGDTIMSIGIVGFLFFGPKGKLFAGLMIGAAKLLETTVEEAKKADQKIAKNRNEIYANIKPNQGSHSEFEKIWGFTQNFSMKDRMQKFDESEAQNNIRDGFSDNKEDMYEFYDADAQGRAELSYKKYEELFNKKRELDKLILHYEDRLKDKFVKNTPEATEIIGKNIPDLKNQVEVIEKQLAALSKVNASISGFIPQDVSDNGLAEGIKQSTSKFVEESDKQKNAIKKWFEDRKAHAEKIAADNEQLKSAALQIETTKGTPFDQMTLKQVQAFRNKYLGLLTEFEGLATPVGKISKNLQRDLMDFEGDFKKIAHPGGFLGDVAEIRSNIFKKALRAATDIKGSDNIAEFENDIKSRREFIKRTVEKMKVDDGQGYSGLTAEDQQFVDAQLAELALREQNFRVRAQRSEHKNSTSGLNLELEKVREIGAAETKALDMMIMKMNHQREYNILSQIERDAVSRGLMDKQAATANMSYDQLEELAIKGQMKQLNDEALRLDLERHFLGNETIIQAEKEARLSQLKLDNARMKSEIDNAFDKDEMIEMNEMEVNKLTLERQNLAMKLSLMSTDEYQAENAELETEKLAMEQAVLEQKMALMENEEYRAELLELELQKMEMERANLELKLELLQSEGYQDEMEQTAVLESQIELQELMNQWGMDFSTFWQTNVISGVQQWQGMLADGITNFIMGTGSMKNAFKSFVGAAIKGIVSMFAKWISQRIMLFVMEKVFGMATATTATAQTAAAGAAATAAWTPAAVAASIATYGGALAFGPMALAQIAAAGVGTLALGGGGSAFGPEMGGGGIVGGPGYHDGGLVEHRKRLNFSNMTGGLKPDETMKKLQVGEMVIPRDQVQATLDALAFADGGFMGIGTSDIDSFATSSDNMSDDDIEDMSQVTKPDIVNYFDWEQVDRHLTDNPDSVVNIIQQDDRDNGSTRNLMRR